MAIKYIVQAARQGRNWRVAHLLDQFVDEADLPGLLALRQALEGVSPHGHRGS
ncbi:hypothetical protein P8605_08910 [Streptomyces sp. T-3]|nr:hypothetical protein [Streptomyces sp. T-3]